MKRALAIVGDYLLNALVSAAIGALLSLAVALIQGDGAIALSTAAGYSLIGLVCGSSSKAAIEGAFALFGRRRLLAYLLNAAVIAVVIYVFAGLVFDGFGPLEGWKVVLVFAVPEAASILLVRNGIREARKFEHAFESRRKLLDSEEGRK